MYIYICIYTYIYVYIYTYTYFLLATEVQQQPTRLISEFSLEECRGVENMGHGGIYTCKSKYMSNTFDMERYLHDSIVIPRSNAKRQKAVCRHKLLN